MFFIIGGDGKEYGPAATSQIRAWIEGGRANLDTKAKAIGSDEWRPLRDYAEFGGPATPPPVPSAPVSASEIEPSAEALASLPALDLAGRGVRTGAALVNAFLYFVCMMPGSTMMGRKLLEQNPELAKGGIPRFEDIDLTGFGECVAWVWAGILGAMLVQSILIGVRGQNIGKLLFGARVVRAVDGEPAGFVRGALLRFAVPVLIIICLNVVFPLGLLFLLVDYCFIFREDRRCLHDLMAGTVVVRA